MSEQEAESLYHYGVKGMRWGVRRAAQRDANESAKAKMFYGEGAGTRRKLIKAQVESRSKDEKYKAAFDHYFAQQDLGKRAVRAKGERRRKDIANTTTKTGRGLINFVNGNPQAASALAVSIGTIGVFAHRAGVDKMLVSAGKTAYSAVKTEARAQMIKRQFNKMQW